MTVVAIVAALLTLLFFPLRRPMRVSMPGSVASGSGGVIDIDASEVRSNSGSLLPAKE